MKTTKRILSSILALVMLFSVCSTGFSVSAVESNGAILDEIVLEPIARPKVTFTVTPVTRVALAANSLEPGNQIVKATPSGVPELSGSYAAQAYAGETPVATKISFVSNTVGVTPKGITCSNESVVLSDLNYNNGTYSCEIVSGTAEPGSAIIFTIDYEWTDGNSYQEKCVTFVENIANGGSYVEAQSEIQALSGTGSYYRVWASASTRLLGNGVYYEQPANIVTSSGDPYRTYGTYNVATGTYAENVAAGYNTSIFTDDKSDKPAGKMNQANELFVPGTTIAHVYVDSSVTKTLADAKIRLDANVGQLSDRNNSNPYTALEDAWVSAGSNGDNQAAATTNDAAAQTAIGLALPAKQNRGVTGFEQNAAKATMTGGVGQYQNLFTQPLTGNVANLVDGSSYTITTKYYAYMWTKKGLLQHYNMTSSATVPTTITFHIVDKGALRDLINMVLNSEPENETTRGKTKGANPQAWYYRSGFSQFQTAYVEALRVYNNPKATQSEIDAATKSLQTMYNGLQLKTADYSRVDDLTDQAEAILDNASAYRQEDINLINQALNDVKKSYNILYQGAVDTMAKNLDTAIRNVKPKAADYAKVEEAKAEASKLNKADYTTDSWNSLQSAINAVVYGKDALEQNAVDAMAEAINNAIKNLKVITADLTALKAKLAEAKAIDRSLYNNGSLLLKPMDDAQALIDEDVSTPIHKDRQGEVDAVTKSLEDAIKGLTPKSADKVELKAAIDAEIPGVIEYYDQDILAEYDAIVLEGVVLYNDSTLTMLEQSIIDAKTAEIKAKYAELMASYDESCKHKFLKPAVKENEVIADCTTDGSYDTVVYCADCGAEVSRVTTTLPAFGHFEDEPVIENKVDVDCTTDGSYDTVIYCLDCGEEVSRVTTTTPAFGHFEDDAVVENNVAADCENGGSFDTVVYCLDCGEEVSRVTTTTPALGHVDGEEVTENAVAAGCTTDGSYDLVVYCSVCNEEISRETKTTGALGHTDGEAVKENEVAADCVNNGSYDTVVYCTVCNEEISRNTVTVDALGHTEGEAVTENEVAADCVNNGSYDTVVYCTVCNEEIIRNTVTVDALGHTEGEAVTENEVAADCVNNGSYDTVVYCTVCDAEISRETTTVDALGHTESEAVEENRVEATYDAAGSYDSVVYCSVCGEEISRVTVEIPMLDGYFKAAEGTTTVIDKELGFIYGLDIGLMDLEGYVEYSKSVSYEVADGIGTGMTLTTFRGGEEWETYTIIIFGDLNGDGVIDIYDASILAAIVNGDMELEEGDPILFAADLNGDTVADIYDLAILNSVVNGETEIGQVPLA